MKKVIYRYLDCGDLYCGFARVKCEECGHEYLPAFSCKRRHFCPSCHQKRLIDEVLKMLKAEGRINDAVIENMTCLRATHRQVGWRQRIQCLLRAGHLAG